MFYRTSYWIGQVVKCCRLGYRNGYDAGLGTTAPHQIGNDAIEAAYWLFDHKKKGSAPMSERDAFKWSVRNLLAGASQRRGSE
jgi:hypothetical protein